MSDEIKTMTVTICMSSGKRCGECLMCDLEAAQAKSAVYEKASSISFANKFEAYKRDDGTTWAIRKWLGAHNAVTEAEDLKLTHELAVANACVRGAAFENELKRGRVPK